MFGRAFAAKWLVLTVLVGMQPVSAFAESHGALEEGVRGRYSAPQADDEISRQRRELADGIAQLRAMIGSQKDFPLEDLKELMALLEERLKGRGDLADLFPGETLDEPTQRLLLDNVALLIEYGIQTLSLYMNDPTTPADQVRDTAAQNMRKTWERYRESKQSSWLSPAGVPLTDLGAESPSAHPLWLGRAAMISTGSGKVTQTQIAILLRKIQADAAPPKRETVVPGPSADSGPVTAPASALLPESRDFLKQIQTLAPEKQEQAGKLVEDYEMARRDFERWYGRNIRGKTAQQLGEDLLKELKQRSEGVARLENSLKQMFEVPADFKEAVERFKRDPRKFAEEEADAFITRLRREDPEKAEELENMVAEYKTKLEHFQAEVAKLRGKRPEEIGREALEKLRQESKLVTNLEEDIYSLMYQFEEQKEKIEREVKQKVDELARHLDRNYKRVLDEELKGVDAELSRIAGEVEKARRDVEDDLRKLEGILFGKKK